LLVYAICTAALLTHTTVWSTEEGSTVSSFVLLLAGVNTALTVANGYQWIHDGSNGIGIAGIVTGTAGIVSVALEHEDLGSTWLLVFGTISAASIVTGIGALTRDPAVETGDQSRIELTPSVVYLDGKPAPGLQLIARW
jgi:hypothetical protein